jgi:hypothetical protein
MRPRAAIEDLKLIGNKGNLKRALTRPPEKVTAKRAELEEMFETVKARRAEALADIRENGQLIWQDKWSAGKLIRVRIINPAVKIAQQCERQLASLAKMLTNDNPDPAKPAEPLTGIEELESMLGKAN